MSIPSRTRIGSHTTKNALIDWDENKEEKLHFKGAQYCFLQCNKTPNDFRLKKQMGLVDNSITSPRIDTDKTGHPILTLK